MFQNPVSERVKSYYQLTSFLKVELDEEAAQAITDSAGFITKEDFMKFAKEKKLVDFEDRKGGGEDTPKKEWAPTKTTSTSSGLLCCCSGGSVSPEPELDRVELAFKRMDKNKDGYITWEEFTKVLTQSNSIQI